MAHASGDSPYMDLSNPSKVDPTANEQQLSQPSSPSFPNTRLMNSTTDLSRNPGIFDDVFKKIKGKIEFHLLILIENLSLDLMPPTFEGAKLSVTKLLSSHFQVSHSMTLSSGANSGYKFGANYVGTQLYSHAEIFPVILGDVDANGNSNAQIIHQWNDQFRTRLLAQVLTKSNN